MLYRLKPRALKAGAKYLPRADKGFDTGDYGALYVAKFGHQPDYVLSTGSRLLYHCF